MGDSAPEVSRHPVKSPELKPGAGRSRLAPSPARQLRAGGGFLLFNVVLFFAGMGGMFFRMARDNDDLVRAVLVLVAGSALTLLLAVRPWRVPAALAVPCLGWGLAMFLTSFTTINAGESLKEFLKIGVYLVAFLGLASLATRTAGIDSPVLKRTVPAALALAGAALGWLHAHGALGIRPFALWSDAQVAASTGASALFAAAFALALCRGTVREAVLRGLTLMALIACGLGLLQFYDLDPLRPWDPRHPYSIHVRDLPADLMTLLASFTKGRLQMDGQGLVLVLPRILGIYGNPDFFAPYLLQFIPLSVAVAVLDPRRRTAGALLAAFLLAILYLTQVWGAFFSLVVLAPFFASLLAFASGRISWPRAVRLTAALMLGGIFVLALLTWLLYSSGRKSAAIQERLVKYRMAAKMWEMAPVIGVGLNAYKSWYPVIQQRVRLQHDLPFESLGSSFTQENRTHNDIAQMLAETGVLGTGLFAWFMTALLAGALRFLMRKRDLSPADRANVCGLAGGVLVVLVYSLPNFPFHIVSSAGTFWIMAGLLASYRDPAAPPEATPGPAEPGCAEPGCAEPGCAEPGPAGFGRTIAWGSALTVLLLLSFSARLFLGTLVYKRADTAARRTAPPDPRTAAAGYARAIELDHTNAQYVYDYGAMCFNVSAENPELAPLAEPLLKRALTMGFVNEDLAYGLGYIAESAGRADEALRWYSMATSLNERHGPSREGRMRILLRRLPLAEAALAQGRYARARDLYREALERDPANYLAAYKLGTISVTPFGETEAGILFLELAAQTAVNEPSFHFSLGRALYLAGRLAEARDALAKAVALDPADSEARSAVAQVDRMLAEPRPQRP